ncbi:MAG: MFS transporter, partial [Ktedonobacterales bacterium]|nr:MFS transporter [Ktedonobacterales bacterium]
MARATTITTSLPPPMPFGANARLRATLLSTALLDELALGMLVVALPLVRERLHLTYTEAGALFTVGALSSLVLEPPLNLASDRGSKRLPVLGGMFALVVGFLLAGSASGFGALALAFALIFPATGAAVGLAQAALIDASAAAATRTMARWTLLSGIGDLLAPLAVTVAASLALGWSDLCRIAALLWLIAALFTLPQRFPPADAPTEEGEGASESLLARVRAALRHRALRWWVVVLLMANMLDEIFL